MKQPSRGRDPESTCRGCRRRRTRCRLGPTAGSRRARRAKSGCRVHQGHGLHGQEVERWCGREGNQARQWETSREDYPADKTVIMPAAGGRSGHKPFPDLGLQQSAPKARSPLSSVHATLAGSVELEVLPSALCNPDRVALRTSSTEQMRGDCEGNYTHGQRFAHASPVFA